MIDRKNIYFRAGACIAGFMLLIILIGAVWTPYDPSAIDGAAKNSAPSWPHLLGTDKLGRDILSRVLQGAGATFVIAAATVAIGLAAGLVIGGFTGYYGGWIDELLMRLNDSLAAFPSILLALVLIALFDSGSGGQGSILRIILVLGILFIPSFARIVRSEVAKQKNLDYVASARLMGVGDLRILFVHIMPNTVPVLLSSVAIGFNNAVLAEASMSYLGLGVSPSDPSLGRMLNEAYNNLLTAPWYAASAGAAIILLVLGFGLLSEGLGGGGDA